MKSFLLIAIVAMAGSFGHAASRPTQRPAQREVTVAHVLDDWHEAASVADEKRYFGHLAEDSIFMGTDATERWTKKQFQDYAHPFFARGRAWSFKAARRSIQFSKDGNIAWFEEDLETPNLGPARGSGVLRREKSQWRIVQYNLSVPIPNGVFDKVKKVIAEASAG